jgi:hypothetical protein
MCISSYQILYIIRAACPVQFLLRAQLFGDKGTRPWVSDRVMLHVQCNVIRTKNRRPCNATCSVQCYQNQKSDRIGRPKKFETGPDQIARPQKFETGPDRKKTEQKSRSTKNYIKYSKFEKKHIYSCASIQIQTIYTQICKDSHLYIK